MTRAETSAIKFSVVVPCFNECDAVRQTVRSLEEGLEGHGEYELIFVDDGSTDGTGEELDQAVAEHPRLRVLHHPANRGYGAALKTGLRRAASDTVVITDADGTYPNERIPDLLAQLGDADMVVGARLGAEAPQALPRRFAKWFLERYMAWLAAQPIPDMNSGLRVFRRSLAERFINILPDGFSFTTTITLAMMTNGFVVDYLPISYARRVGRSKIQPIRDTLRFIQLIVRTGMYFAPLRVLTPVLVVLALITLVALGYDIWVLQNLTDKSILLMLATLNTAMFALLADMIDKRLGR